MFSSMRKKTGSESISGQIGFNLDKTGTFRTIRAVDYKSGLANYLYHPDDGFIRSCVLEYEMTEENGDGSSESADD